MVKRGTSKRDRKRKDANSCKPKVSSKTSALPLAAAAAKAPGAGQGAARASGPQLLDSAVFKSLASQELENRDGDEDDGNGSNALIIDPSRQKAKAKTTDDGAEAPQLSKSQLRKLRKVEEIKQLRAERSQVMASLSEHSATDQQLSLLRPLSKAGQRETKREGLSRALRMQRAGLSLPEGFKDLERNREEKEAESGDGFSSSDSDSEPETRAGIRAAPGGAEDPGSEPDEGPAVGSKAGGGSAPLAAAEAFMSPEAIQSAVEAARLQLGLPAKSTEGDERAAALKKSRKVASVDTRNTKFVQVQRPEAVEEGRQHLPIIGYEQEVMEAVAASDVVMLSGETGCGKTTQVPQFLLEGGFGSEAFPERKGLIGITQPRRVAAISTATRVAHELGESIGQTVGYQVRYDKAVGESTAMKFMTDGILLRELQEDFLLSKYSVIVLDEAHERSLNSDLLLGMLSRVVPLRRRLSDSGEARVTPLKLVVMSATLQLQELTGNKRLFPSSKLPIIHVPARCYPVTLHFARRTELDDYTGAAFRKVCRIHKELPPGGILVFLTGQREVDDMCKKLKATFAPPPPKKDRSRGNKGPADGKKPQEHQQEKAQEQKEDEDEEEEEDSGIPDRFGAADNAETDLLGGSDEVDLGAEEGDEDDYERLEAEAEADEEEDEVQVLGGEGMSPEDIAAAEAKWDALAPKEGEEGRDESKVRVLPLYGMLSKQKQDRVFGEVQDGERLIVVATNVAETSLTIPGIRYIVDAGRSKQKILEGHSGMSRFDVRWISKASAQQRAGRAGRVGPGHCYRLYSSAHFNDTFPDHSPPEIVNTPLEGVVLVMKAMGVDKVLNFPFPTSPEREAIQAAERCLFSIMALDGSGRLTATGRSMAALPVSPRHARMLLEVAERVEPAGDDAAPGSKRNADREARDNGGSGVLAYALALTAAMSVEQPFVHTSSVQVGEGGDELAQQKARSRIRHAHRAFREAGPSDALAAMTALLTFEEKGSSADWCMDNALHYRHLSEGAALRRQLSRYLAQGLGRSPQELLPDPRAPLTPVPSSRVSDALRRGTAAGWADQVARRVKPWEQVQKDTEGGRRNKAVRYSCAVNDFEIFLHPNSAMHATSPDLVVYKELVRNAKRPYMAVVTEVEASWLPEASPALCALSDALVEPPPSYKAGHDSVMAWHSATYGPKEWPLPPVLGPYKDVRLATATFAAALLAGEVLPCCAALGPELAAPAKWAARPENQAQKRVGQLVGALESAKVCSRRRLAEAWSSKPEFLREELLGWIRKGRGAVLDTLWPVMQEEARMGADAAARKRKKSRKLKSEKAKAPSAVKKKKASSGGGSSSSAGKWIM